MPDMLQLIADTFSELRASIPKSGRMVRHGIAGGGVERDGSGIWVPGDPWSGISGDKLTMPMAQHATVYAAVNVISRNFSSVKLEFFKGDSDKPLSFDDSIVRLFESPEKRAGLRQRQFLAKYAQDMELSGDWFVLFDEVARPMKSAKAIPTVLKRVPRSKMRPDINQATGEFKGWIYDGKLKIPPELVMHSMYPNPYNDYMGLAPLSAALLEADSDFQAQLWNRYVFENGSPGYVFTKPNDEYSNRAKDEVFEQDFAARHQGSRRISKVAVLPPGMDMKEMAANHRDMSFAELRGMSRRQVLSVFSVPPPVAGDFEDATLANIVHALRFFWYHKLFPMMDEYESVVQTDLLDRFNTGVRCAFKRESVMGLIDDLAEKLSSAAQLHNMGIPFAEINDRLDLGFDTANIPGSDMGFLPFSVTPVEALLAGEDEESEEEAPVPPKPTQQQRLVIRHASPALRAKRWQSYMRATERAERDMLAAWRGFLKWASTEAISDLHAMVQAAAMNLIQHKTLPPVLPDDEEVIAQAKKRTGPAHVKAYRAGRSTAESDLGASLDFDLLDVKVLKANQERAIPIRSAALAERDRIRRVVDRGIQAGDPVDEIEAGIKKLMRSSMVGMARTVARTETLSAFAKAREDAFGEAGVEKQEWLSARDSDVRPTHQIDGEVVRIGSAFSNGLRYPTDPNGPPEETINCRCVVLPVVE